MAKRARTSPEATSNSPVRAATHTLESFAEDLGALLGHAQSKAESWLSQRNAIAAQLTGLRDAASRLLTQLGVEPFPPVRRGRPRKAITAASSIRPRVDHGQQPQRRVMSAEARAKIAAAQRARWARQKKASNK